MHLPRLSFVVALLVAGTLFAADAYVEQMRPRPLMAAQSLSVAAFEDPRVLFASPRVVATTSFHSTAFHSTAGGATCSGSAYPDSAYPDSAYPDSAYPDSACSGSACSDSAYPDSACSGSAYPDSACSGTGTDTGAKQEPCPEVDSAPRPASVPSITPAGAVGALPSPAATPSGSEPALASLDGRLPCE